MLFPNLGASSWVGAIMSAIGDPAASAFSRRHLASAGRRKPSVLPLPVFAIASTSRPETAMGQVACCLHWRGFLKVGLRAEEFHYNAWKGRAGQSQAWQRCVFLMDGDLVLGEIRLSAALSSESDISPFANSFAREALLESF